MNAALAALSARRLSGVTSIYVSEGMSVASGAFLVSDTGTVQADNITTTSGDNTINGTLTVTGDAAYDGESFFNGNVTVTDSIFKVENTTNSKFLSVDALGNLQYSDGNASAGRVLTSDGTGIATWQDAAGGGGDVTSTGTNTFTQLNTFTGGIDVASVTATGGVLTMDGVVKEIYNEGAKQSVFMTTLTATANVQTDLFTITADDAGIVLVRVMVTAYEPTAGENYPYIGTFDLTFKDDVIAQDVYEEAVSYTLYTHDTQSNVGAADTYTLKFLHTLDVDLSVYMQVTYVSGDRADYTVVMST